MTRRSILLGFAGVLFVCGLSFFNDRVLRSTNMVGNHMPVSVYGLLIVFVLAINPLLRRRAFSGREIAVVLALVLASCVVPGSGLLRTFTDSLIQPHRYAKTEPGWAQLSPPAIRAEDVRDFGALRALVRAEGADAESRARAAVAARLSDARADEGLLASLDALLADRSFAGDPAFDRLRLPAWLARLRARDPDGLTPRELALLNRGIIDVLFEGAIAVRWPGVVEQVPHRMLADVSRDEDAVLGGFTQGLGGVGGHARLGDMPWGGWTRTLLFWVPLILSLWGATVALAIVVHRQWSDHEQLPYPIATFTDALLPTGDDPRPNVLRDRLFWIGAAPVMLVYFNNYLFLWAPDVMIHLPTRIDLSAMAELFPTFASGGGARLLAPTVLFSVVGIAYLLPSDVSFSFGIGPFLWALTAGALAAYGFSLNGAVEGRAEYIALKPSTFLLFGANVAVFVAIAYTGRRAYATVFRRGLSLKADDEARPAEVWAARAFVALTALFILQVAWGAGTGIALAVLYTAVLLVMFVTMSRLVAEAGLFYMQPYFFPCVMLWGLLGARAIGPGTLLILQVLTMVLAIDPREALMPYVTNALRLLDRRRAPLGRAGAWAAGAVVAGLAVALPVTLYIQYDQGSMVHEGWATRAVSKMPFENAVSMQHRLSAQGVLVASERASFFERLVAISPNGTCLWALAIGFAVTLCAAFARLRFTWWPIHPLLFVTWGTEPLRRMCGAFLVGWVVKALVMKYGGAHTYARARPLMIGLIAGEILGALVPMAIGALYYAITGLPPAPFAVMPG